MLKKKEKTLRTFTRVVKSISSFELKNYENL